MSTQIQLQMELDTYINNGTTSCVNMSSLVILVSYTNVISL